MGTKLIICMGSVLFKCKCLQVRCSSRAVKMDDRNILLAKELSSCMMKFVKVSNALKSSLEVIIGPFSAQASFHNSFQENRVIARQMKSELWFSTQRYKVFGIFRRSWKSVEQNSLTFQSC